MKTFVEWIKQQECEASPLAAINRKTIKAHKDRDRLTRMETMLQELVSLQQIEQRNDSCQ
jgi:hypothetical protein